MELLPRCAEVARLRRDCPETAASPAEEEADRERAQTEAHVPAGEVGLHSTASTVA